MDNKTQLFLGNNIELLRQLPDNSVDAIVTDPPYGLGEEPNPTQVLQSWITTGYHEIEGKGFMGKEWDAFVPQPIFWKEAYRVLKHGGHVLSFFGTRTYDWGVMAMRFAGFEVRDCIQWLYGCLSSDTEILTENGWVSYDHFRKTKEGSIFVYNPKTDEYFFEQPTKWNEYSIQDTAYRIKSDFTDQIVSRNHRCLVEREGKLLFEFAEALAQEHQANIPFLESLPNLSISLPDIYEGTSIKKQILWSKMRKSKFVNKKIGKTKNANSIKSGQGFNMPYLSINILATKLKTKKNENTSLFKKMQRVLSGSRVEETWSQGVGILVGRNKAKKPPISNGREKPIVERGNNLSKKERVLFGSKVEICEMPERVYSDGKERWICGRVSFNNGKTIRQTAFENGMRTPYRPQPDEQRYNESDVVCIEQGTQTIRTRGSYSTTLATITPIEYSGIIFCPTVSTGAFVARRNGKIFITGNSGFPKSHNISKAIDKKPNLHFIKEWKKWLGVMISNSQNTQKEINDFCGFNAVGYARYDSNDYWATNRPTNEKWEKMKKAIGITTSEWDFICDSNEEERGFVEPTGGLAGGTGNTVGNFKGKQLSNNSISDAAKQWDGWGSALKPANEPIVLARKPLEKGLSIAENVLKHSTGGLNIDGCRVGNEVRTMPIFSQDKKEDGTTFNLNSNIQHHREETSQGRFPANLILTHHPDCECVGTKKVKAISGGVGENSMGGMGKNGIYGEYALNKLGANAGGLGDENGQETIENWNCVEGGYILSPCIYLDGYEITKFNYHSYSDLIQRHKDISHILEYPYTHNKDTHNFLDYETFHDLGWKQLPSFRVYYPFLCRFYDALVQTFQVYDQLSVRQLNDALYVANHFLELLHNHLHLSHDHLSNENDSYLFSLSRHILENKEFFHVFLNKISYYNVDILFRELAKTDFRDNILKNKIFEDFLFYLTKMELNNSCILHLHQMLFCLSLQINFSEQIYYKKFELPDCPVKLLDEQSGILKSGQLKQGHKQGQGMFGKVGGDNIIGNYGGDSGGASRFFYTAKASKEDRNEGLKGFEEKQTVGGGGTYNEEAGSKYGSIKAPNKNFHPTVKPTELMRYLCRLITPPNGVVLDPFMGSGSTGKAAILEGFQFIGMELEEEYFKIAEARISKAERDYLDSIAQLKLF